MRFKPMSRIRTPVKQYAHTGSSEIRTPVKRNLHFSHSLMVVKKGTDRLTVKIFPN